METRVIPLQRDKDGKLSPIEENSDLIEQSAMSTILGIMSSNAKPDIRLDAARAALDMIRKRIPAETDLRLTAKAPVVQLNFGSHVMDSLEGMGKMRELSMAGAQKTVFIRNPNDVQDGE